MSTIEITEQLLRKHDYHGSRALQEALDNLVQSGVDVFCIHPAAITFHADEETGTDVFMSTDAQNWLWLADVSDTPSKPICFALDIPARYLAAKENPHE